MGKTKPKIAPLGQTKPSAFDLHSLTRTVDRMVHSNVARRTGGLSPIALGQVWWDWAAHLAASPGRQMELAASAGMKAMQLANDAMKGDLAVDDIRYRDPAWRTWPFNLFAATHKAQEDWWAEATTGLPGVSAAHERVAAFTRARCSTWRRPPTAS